MKSNRGIYYQRAARVFSALSLCTMAMACKIGGTSSEAQPTTTAAPADPGQASIGDVTRYAGQEVNDSGQSSVRTAVVARKSADYGSPSIQTLYPGTVVTRVAHFGNYSLVSWPGALGPQQGWVDTNLAFNVVRWLDAGATTPVVTAPTTPPSPVVTTPPAVTTTPPSPVVTTPPPPTVTAPPPKTVTPPPPPPKPTTTTTAPPGKIFKPPVIAH